MACCPWIPGSGAQSSTQGQYAVTSLSSFHPKPQILNLIPAHWRIGKNSRRPKFSIENLRLLGQNICFKISSVDGHCTHTTILTFWCWTFDSGSWNRVLKTHKTSDIYTIGLDSTCIWNLQLSICPISKYFVGNWRCDTVVCGLLITRNRDINPHETFSHCRCVHRSSVLHLKLFLFISD
jgi:hypothetical protein